MTDRKGTLRNAVLAVLFLIAVMLSLQAQGGFIFSSRLSVEVKVPSGGDTFQVFFDKGAGYNEADSVRAEVKGGSFEKVRFAIPAVRVGKVRIDPGTR
ncbi:MAG: hypothetical protein IT388_02795 [Nitrospirales bacterium]|nr:hypothetical protein [Nitrospirales bacterium]